MLKSVSLDDKEHTHLIKFIHNYRDENGNNNISSAIRYLMQKGYEYLSQQTSISSQNTDNIKYEILNEVLSEINNKLLDKLLSTQNQQVPVMISPPMMSPANWPIQQMYSGQPGTTQAVSTTQNTSVNNAITESAKTEVLNNTNIEPSQKINTVIHTVTNKQPNKKLSNNTLLNNLLSNASR